MSEENTAKRMKMTKKTKSERIKKYDEKIKQLDQELEAIRQEKTLLYRQLQPVYYTNVFEIRLPELMYTKRGVFSSVEIAKKFSYISDYHQYIGVCDVKSSEINDFTDLDQDIK